MGYIQIAWREKMPGIYESRIKEKNYDQMMGKFSTNICNSKMRDTIWSVAK